MKHKKQNLIPTVAVSLAACLMITGTIWVSASDAQKPVQSDSTAISEATAEVNVQTAAVTAASAVAESQTETTETRTLQTAVSPTAATQDDVYYLMLNSIDYYDSVSGTIYYPSANSTVNAVQFQCKLSAADAYQHYTQYQTEDGASAQQADITASLSDSAQVLFDQETYCSEALLTVADNLSATYTESAYRAITLDSVCEVADEDRVTVAEDGNPCYSYRTNPTNVPEASISLFPQEMAFGFLTDRSLWEISGTEICGDRECYHIVGKTADGYGDKLNVTTFTFDVDCQTGVLLQYIGYDADGNISDYLYTENMQFEAESEPVTAFSEACIAGYTESAAQ